MKVKFFKDKSKINDFMNFPRLLFIDDDKSIYSSIFYDELKEKGFIKEYEKLLEKIKTDLNPYQKRFEEFISNSNLYNSDIMDFLVSDLLFREDLNIKSKDDLFNIILSMDERELIHSTVSTLLLNIIYDESRSFKDLSLLTIEENMETLYDMNKLFKIVNESNLAMDTKWNFMVFYNDPNGYIKRYIDLMNEIYPVFIEYYNLYEDIIISIGNKIENIIKKEGVKAINKLTLSVLDDNILNNTEFLRILISFTLPNTITFSESMDFKNVSKRSITNTIIWGINYEKITNAIIQKKEDDIGNRVDIFKSLGDRTRYEILRLISTGISSNKELAEKTNVSTATISYHVNSFVENGILIIKRIDNKLTHVIDYEVLKKLIIGFKEDFKIK